MIWRVEKTISTNLGFPKELARFLLKRCRAPGSLPRPGVQPAKRSSSPYTQSGEGSPFANGMRYHILPENAAFAASLRRSLAVLHDIDKFFSRRILSPRDRNTAPGIARDSKLTYMSIQEEITTHLMAGRLRQLPHTISRVAQVRTIVLNRAVWSAVDSSQWSEVDRYRLGSLRGELDRFIGGDRVSVMLLPKQKPPTTYLKRLKPVADEVWEIRCCGPEAGVRVLGRFSDRDKFIGLAWDFRERASWKSLCQQCLDEWRKLFPHYGAHDGRSAAEYVSNSFSV